MHSLWKEQYPVSLVLNNEDSEATLNPDHVLHEQLVGKQNAHQGRLKSRRPFVPAAQKLLDSLTESDIRAAQWMDYV